MCIRDRSVTFRAKPDITTSNPTEFTITGEGLSNSDASVTFDDITIPIVKNVTVEPCLLYTSYIIRTGLIMIVCALISLIGGFLAMYFSSKAAYGFGSNLRQDMLSKIQEFSFSNINKFSTSSLVTRLTNDVEIIQQLVQMMLRMLIRAPFMLIGGIVLTIAMSPSIEMIFLIITPLLALTMVFIIKKAFPLFTKVQTKIDKVNGVIRENLIGARVVKSFVREDFESERFEKANVDLKETTIKSFHIMILLMPLVMLIMNVAIAAVLWLSLIHIYLIP